MRELYAHEMSWDPFLEDLEHQFVSERELERGALAGETERARVAALALRDRLAGLGSADLVTIRDASGETHRLVVRAVGAHWVAGEAEGSRGATLVRIDAIDELRIPAVARPASLAGADPDPLRDRMPAGFALRALARRRAVVTIGTTRGARHAGTIARAGADHLDIALHDTGSSVSEAREEATVAFRAIAWIRTADRSALDV